MRNQINLKARISLYGPDWVAMKEWLNIEREHILGKLLKAKTHDEAQEHRGAIALIDKLLFVEKDAAMAASAKG